MFEGRRVEAVLVAAGRSARMGFDKLSYPVAGVPVLALAFRALAGHPYVDRVVLVAGENFEDAKALVEAAAKATALAGGKPVAFATGGDTRAASVAAGVALCAPGALVAIHDAARPFVSEGLISRVVEAAAGSGAAAPALPLKDTVKQAQDGQVVRTLPRESLAAVQTPQVFDGDAYRAALAALSPADYPALTDDCMVMERAGKRVVLVAGEEENIKITTRADLPKEDVPMRIGHGYDVHAFAEGRPLILGGVTVPHDRGLAGHSDADVLCHAVSDALLGALALGDIGKHFPDTDPAYEGADSLLLLAQVGGLLAKAGWRPGNLDATLVCQAPRLAPHIPAMGANIARALGIGAGAVSVKATTEERLGFTGREEGIAAHCVALVCPMNG